MIQFNNKSNLVLGLEGSNRSLDKGGRLIFQTLSFTHTFEENGLVVLTSDVAPPDIDPHSTEGKAALRGITQRIENARDHGTHVVVLVRSPSLSPGTVAAQLLPDYVEMSKDASEASITAEVKEMAQLAKVYGRTNVQFNVREEAMPFVSVRMASVVDEVTCKGFADRKRLGMLFFLPVYPLPQDTNRFVQELLRAVEADLSALLSPATHPIADDFEFSAEGVLASEHTDLLGRLSEIEASRAAFQSRKSILFLRDRPLQSIVPKWIEENLGIATEQIEGKNEDFWLLSDDPPNRIAIGEIKGLSANVRKQHVTMLVQHRQENDLPEDYPSLLVMNTFANASSVHEKDKERVSPDVVKWASKNNVLIIRTLDLVRIADFHEQGQLTSEEVLSKLMGNSGWLRANREGELAVLHK